jgi:hypothetical protein
VDTHRHLAERHALGVVVALTLANAGSLAGFALLAWALGADRALEPGTWRESDAFAVGAIGAALIAAGLGGAACRLIARRRAAVGAAAVILASWWGLENALKLANRDPSPPRSERATFVEGAQGDLIVEPRWAAMVSPVVVGIGVVIGAVGASGTAARAPDHAT